MCVCVPVCVCVCSLKSSILNPSLLDCSVRFVESEVLVNEEMHLDVCVRSSFPSPIRFDALRLQFSDTSYNVSSTSLWPSLYHYREYL